MSKMMDRWLQKAKEGDKGLTRPPASARVSQHKNEVRSIARGFFQSQFRVSAYKPVGRPRHDSRKVKSYRASRLRLRRGVFGSSIAGEMFLCVQQQ